MSLSPPTRPVAPERKQVTMDELLVTMTRQQLRELLEQVMRQVAAKPEPEVLDLQATAKFFGVHPRTVMGKFVKERGCPCHHIGPQNPRFRRSEILEWLTAQPTYDTTKEQPAPAIRRNPT